MSRFEDLLEGMRCDLRDIGVGIRWAWHAAYSKAGRGLDAVRGASLARTEAEQDAGPTYDLSLGDHASRVAVQRVGTFLARCEVQLNIARLHLGQPTVCTSFALVQHGEVRDLALLVHSVRVVDRLMVELEQDWHTADDLARRRALRWVLKASKELRNAVGGLDRALRRGEESNPSVPECVNGGCKNLADARGAALHEGGLCARCARYRRRNGALPSGHRLSPELDRNPYAMQNKRRANGLDHGDESLSHAWRGTR